MYHYALVVKNCIYKDLYILDMNYSSLGTHYTTVLEDYIDKMNSCIQVNFYLNTTINLFPISRLTLG